MRTVFLFIAFLLAAPAAFSADDMAYKFAAIAAGKRIDPAAPEVSEARVLLGKAAKQYGVTDQEAADLVVKGMEIAKAEKFDYRLFEVLEALPVMDPKEPSSRARMREVFTAYLTARKGGRNHSEALVGVRGLYLAQDKMAKR